MDWLDAIYEQHFSFQAANGAQTWYNLMLLPTYLTANTQVVVIDTANDTTNTVVKDSCSLEAFIRNVWTYAPGIHLIGISAPSWNTQDIGNDANAPTPTNINDINAAKSIFQYYGVSYVAYLDAVVALVQAGHHLNEYVSVDTVHPSVAGYALMASLIENYLPFGGAVLSGALPARLDADTADFEYTPQRLNGTAYDSRTGAWTDDGTKTSSAAAGATITFSGTFRSFGYYAASGSYPNVSVSIDGGAAINPFNAGRNGYDTGARASHTIVITVLTSCTIDEFWAI